ncbi:speckle-type POZ protein-like [Parasteatoda tepidariorum]|uniref:speckle-type POZ protein-like n=1 Tax=Parasteatoda tepidariorum TaxID=114398 RepID=UPI00077FA370|nr:speckle-type POZ protein-like [Parasteatoda tepidariorum]
MKVLEEGLNTDIELTTAEESIKAHKIILQARSPVFYKMFSHDSIEASENAIAISDIRASTLKKLVTFLYTGRMEKCNFDEAMELYYAADKYEVLSLRDDCREELLRNLDVNNACSLFTLANRHNDEDFRNGVVQLVSANFPSVVNMESINDMSKDDIILLMRLCVPGIKKE